MKETGLMFKAPLVRAILSGQKTQTRRIAKDVKHPGWGNVYTPSALAREPQHTIDAACPYGQPGDRIYVRETFARVPTVCGGDEMVFAADYQDGSDKASGVKYTPAIHMPKDLARIWLEVAGMRVERLQAISESDAEAEGVDFLRHVPDADESLSAKQLFECLWESTGGDWAANPWVWILEFKRIDKPAT